MLARNRLPDQVEVSFGPQAIISRFILQGDREARERGVYLSIEHDFDELIAFNKTQTETWYPMIPIFDPAASDLTSENAFWIAGRDRDGEIVTTQCARLYDWRETNFDREFESMRFAYRDPDLDRWPEECTFSNAPSGKRVSGLVCYSGGAWYRPDFRGQGLASIIPRLSRTIAYSWWNTDFTISLVEPVLIERGVVARYGYTRVEEGIDWLNSFRGHMYNLSLLWMDRTECLNDLVTQMSEPVEYRRQASGLR
jgi:hypothetical protein